MPPGAPGRLAMLAFADPLFTQAQVAEAAAEGLAQGWPALTNGARGPLAANLTPPVRFEG